MEKLDALEVATHRRHGWFTKGPTCLLRTRGFLQRKHQPRYHHGEIPETAVGHSNKGAYIELRTHTTLPLIVVTKSIVRMVSVMVCHDLRSWYKLD